MADRAPLSVTFYLDADDAELFRALHEARNGERFDERRHQELVDKGLIEVEEFNPGPNGECMDDVRLTNAGERKLGELRARAADVFEKKRRERGGASVPDSPAVERASGGPVDRKDPISTRARGASAPKGNTHRAQPRNTSTDIMKARPVGDRSPDQPLTPPVIGGQSDAERSAYPGGVS